MATTKRDFTTTTLVTIPVAIAINIVIGQIIVLLKLPLYLDSIGTVFVAVLAGPWVGALTGLLSNLIWGLSGLNVIYTPFAAVAAIIGLLAGLFADNGWFKKWWKVLLGGFITGVVAAAISAPIAYYVFGGVTGTGTDFFVAFFQGMGYDPLTSTFAQGLVSDPIDKTVTFLLVWLILLALPKRFIALYPHGENVE